MRFPRVKAEGQSFYHCVSRVVDRRFIFQTTDHGSAEAERFVLLMRRLEAFSGSVRVGTECASRDRSNIEAGDNFTTHLSFVLYTLAYTHEVPARQG